MVLWPGQMATAERAVQAFEFPPDFRTRDITTNGTTIHVRFGGAGPPVVLLHGYGETGDMWAPMAIDLARDRTLVVPDLRGMGLSSNRPGASTKRPRLPTSRACSTN
jgi:pimeloyl-ACP methyl ester carboxylesterase